ncbi:MAG: hypothetical protein ACOY94_18665, partial [Bacillota bacterium]
IVPGSTLPGFGEQTTMTYRGTTYLVGRTAARQAGVASQADLADDAPVNEESRLLYLAALAYLAGQDGPARFKVVAGLPVDTWENYKDQLKQLLLSIRGEPVELQLGEQTIRAVITVEDAMVMPQPLGSALDFLLDDQGGLAQEIAFPVEIGGQQSWPAETVAGWRWCVVDVGFNTLNTYVLDQLDPVRRFCASPKLGMAHAYQVAGRAAGGRNALEVQAGGQAVGRLAMEQAYQEVGRQITRLIRSWNDPGIAFYLVTGGGAVPLFEQILPGEPAKILAREPQEANGRGYYKAGVQRWGGDGNA